VHGYRVRGACKVWGDKKGLNLEPNLPTARTGKGKEFNRTGFMRKGSKKKEPHPTTKKKMGDSSRCVRVPSGGRDETNEKIGGGEVTTQKKKNQGPPLSRGTEKEKSELHLSGGKGFFVGQKITYEYCARQYNGKKGGRCRNSMESVKGTLGVGGSGLLFPGKRKRVP